MTNQITISNPNPYNSKTNNTPMVCYTVTGDEASVEQFCADSLETGGNGKPLFYVKASGATKYGETAVLDRTTDKDGNSYWFADTKADKIVAELVAGADETTKAAYGASKLAEILAFAQVLASNRTKNITKLQKESSKMNEF